MIQVEERMSNRVPGITSLFISFDYNQDVVNLMKEFEVYDFNKKTKEWEVPIKDCYKILDRLSFYDDVSITTIDTDIPYKDVELISTFKTTPREFQLDAVRFGLTHPHMLLRDDMGCIDGDAEVSVNYKLLPTSKHPSTHKIKLSEFYNLYINHPEVKFSIRALKEEGWFGNCPVTKVTYSGYKQTFRLELEDGRFVCATPDHLILTNSGYKRVDELDVSKDLVASNGTQVCKNCGGTENLIKGKYSKFYGYCKHCAYQLRDTPHKSGRTGFISEDDPELYVGKDGYMRIFYNGVREHPNYRSDGLGYHIYLMTKKLGRGLTPNECVHHIDGNKLNNSLDNLQLLTHSEHAKIHAKEKVSHFHKNFIKGNSEVIMVPKYLRIKSITDSGYRDVYDVSVDDDCHNFIANKIVVHNCGKSASAIYLAQELKERGLIEHCLVICCVDSLRTNWKREIAKHSNLSCRVLGERVTSRGNVTYDTIEKRNVELSQPIEEFFIVTNVSHIRSDDFVNAFNKSKTKIDMLIVDEIHRCNNATKSQQGKNLLKLHAKYQIGLSGTLMTRDAVSYYAPIKWTTTNDLTITAFKKYYCVYSSDDDDRTYPIDYKNLDVLNENLDYCGLRRTKQLPEIARQLPTKTYIDEYVDMTEEHRRLYNDVTSQVHKEVDLVKIYKNNLRALIVRLRQASTCPNVLTSKNIISSKVLRCVEMVENLISQGEKVVVFTTFKEVVKTLGDLLKQYDPYLITGDDKVTYVDNATDEFQKNPNKKLLIATQQKLGTGVTLNAARYLIFVDCPWTDFEYSQATDRVHRLGSKEPVFIYNLICPNTIDEKIAQAINDRRELSQYVDDRKQSEKYHDDIETTILKDILSS